MTPIDYIRQNPQATDAEVLAAVNAQPRVSRPSSDATYITYLLIGERYDLFGSAAFNISGSMRQGLEAWIASGTDLSTLDPNLPNPTALRIINERLAGDRGVDVSSPTAPTLLQLFASGVGPLPAILSAEQAGLLLDLGYWPAVTYTADDIAAARQQLATDALYARVAAGSNRAMGLIATSETLPTWEQLAAAFAEEGE